MEDIEILELFFHRSETAVTALLRQCGRTPGRLAHNLLSCEEDVEECINDAAKEAWDTIPPEMPRSLLAYTCILVRRRAVERIRYRSAGRQEEAETIRMELEESLVSSGDTGESLDDRELQAYLNDFLTSLTPENRCLVIKRYFYCESLRRIRTEMGITPKNAGMRLAQLREQLGLYLAEQGILVQGDNQECVLPANAEGK